MDRQVVWVTCLREMRKARGLTVRELAERAQVNIATVSEAENGGELELGRARRIADVLGLTERDIWPRRV